MENHLPNRKGDDIAHRLLNFAVQAFKIAKNLSHDMAGKHAARQLIRSATSSGANYEEARCAESRADFVHKIRIAAKELRESHYWLRLVDQACLAKQQELSSLIREADELIAIFISSAKTASANR